MNFVSREFRPLIETERGSRSKTFKVSGQPIDIMKLLYSVANEMGLETQLSDTHWKFSFPCSDATKKGQRKERRNGGQNEEMETFKVDVELHELETNLKYTASISRKNASALAFRAFNDVCE